MTRIHEFLAAVLTAAVCLVGLPICALASDAATAPPGQELTLNGRAWSSLNTANVDTANRLRIVPIGPLTQAADQPRERAGQVGGVARNAAGLPLAGQLVELSRPRRDGSGSLTTTTDVNGEFRFTGLGPGRHEARLRRDDQVVASSGALYLVESQMAITGIVLAEPARKARSRGTAMAIGVAVGAGTGALLGLLLAVVAG